MTKFELTDEAIAEIEQLAKAYAAKHHENSSHFVKRRVVNAFVEGYRTGLLHTLMVATEETS